MKKYKWMDFVLGTHNIELLGELVSPSLKKHELKIEAPSCEGDIIEGLPAKRESKIKAYVNIMYGCDKFCTYCIVPYTRGKQWSRQPADIINEVQQLVKDGYKEVTLLGQNVNAYGKDLEIEYNLKNLLTEVAETNIPRIRFITSHPWDFTDDMIDTISKYENIMPSIHLPVQSGSSRVLKIMGRRYTKDSYLELFHKIKDTIPNVSISTDIIVGFPGETEEDFEETLSLANECKFDNAFTFIYSPRENTPAAKLDDNITLEEKEKRLYRLNEVVNKYFLENNKKLVGSIVPVLVEGKNTNGKEGLYGYTDTNKLINFDGCDNLTGKIINVKVTDAKTWSLDGKIVE